MQTVIATPIITKLVNITKVTSDPEICDEEEGVGAVGVVVLIVGEGVDDDWVGFGITVYVGVGDVVGVGVGGVGLGGKQN